MNNDEQAAAARAQQDADAELSGYADPVHADDDRELREPVNTEPEIRRVKRTYPAGTTRPNRAKPTGTSVSFRMDADCIDYLRFLVENGNAGSLTHAVELCIRGDRAAQARK